MSLCIEHERILFDTLLIIKSCMNLTRDDDDDDDFKQKIKINTSYNNIKVI